MNYDSNRLMEIKQGLEELADQQKRLRWEQEQVEKQMLTEFGVKPAKAQQKVAEMRKESEKLRREFVTAMEQVESGYGNLLAKAGK